MQGDVYSREAVEQIVAQLREREEVVSVEWRATAVVVTVDRVLTPSSGMAANANTFAGVFGPGLPPPPYALGAHYQAQLVFPLAPDEHREKGGA